ncbi:MAG: spore germination protein [Cyanobacteria bacterium J083]|nr:MAG: spore germination protein [Cyanobacteria bacterium J083]
MEEQHQPKNHRSAWGLIATVAGLVLVIGAGTAWWAIKSLDRETATKSPIPKIEQPKEKSPDKNALTTQKAEIYWVTSVDNRLQLKATPLKLNQKFTNPEELLKEAIEELLAGSPEPTIYATAIPQGTRLLDIKVEKNNVYINLSKEFTEGGGSASMISRLAQIVYTATSLDPDTQVWLQVEGKPLEYLGGEGLEVQQPMNRSNFNANFEL